MRYWYLLPVLELVICVRSDEVLLLTMSDWLSSGSAKGESELAGSAERERVN